MLALIINKGKVDLMSTITKISSQKRPGRYNVFIDNHYAFSVTERTLAEFVLLKGKEISDEEIERIQQFDDDARASELAARFLSYEPRTIYEVLQYLKKYNISDEAANAAVEQLTELGYIDDEQYTKLFLQNNLHVGSDGPKSLQKKLQQKGVNSETIAIEIENIPEEEWIPVGKKVIKSMQHQVGKLSSNELSQKMKTKLLSHGFDSSLASIIIDETELNLDETDQFEALKKQGIKAFKRFRKFDEKTRNFKIKRYLYSHGFSSNEIDMFLNGEIIDLEELSEY